MKKFIAIAIALLGCCFAANAQYIRSVDECKTAVSYSFNSPVSFSYDEAVPASPDYAKGLKDKKTGTALLITAGACTATGVALYGLSWTLISDSIPDAARAVPIVGISLLGASIPLYIAGSVLYVRGKKATMEAAPGYLAIKF